jgi:DNA repair protein RadD
VLRPAEGKLNAVVLDHSGAVFRHGFVEDRVEWTLDPERRSESPTHAKRLAAGHSSRLLECSRCETMRVAGEPCPNCGFLPQRPPQAIVFKDGDLALVDRARRTAEATSDPHERMRWFAELKSFEQPLGKYRQGFAKVNYKEKFGHWPPSQDIEPKPPSPEVASWVRSRLIAYAKRRQQEQS